MKSLRVLALALFAAATSFAAPSKPNMVYFLVDDMGFADCGFNGGKDIKTPNIDALAAKGSVFENYYVQPVCSTSRSCLMTGRYPIRTGIYGALKNNSKYGLPLNERTLPQALHEAGYTTAICGKWHLGDFQPGYLPMKRGFDHQYGLWLGQIDYFTHISRDGYGGRPDWFRDDKPCDDKGYSTQLLGKEAVRLIHEQPKDKPLFLYLPFNGMHGPWSVPDSYLKRYENLPPDRRMIAAIMTVIDEEIGNVTAALKAAGMEENTLIIFSSDNGGVQPGVRAMNTPLREGKGSLYEGGVRSSAFAVLPNVIPAGKKVASPVHLIDWYPTLLKLAGANTTQPLPIDGVDLWPLLTEGKPLERDALLLAGGPQRAALRMGDWKLLSLAGGPGKGDVPKADDEIEDDAANTNVRVELYHLAKDISETKNLAATEPERVKTMSARLAALMKNAAPSLITPLTQPKAGK